MKSAYERAMERFGGTPTRVLTPAQKDQLAEIDRKYQAKIAEAELMGGQRLQAATDPERLDQVRQEIALEIRSLREKAESEKNKVRHAAG